MVMAKTTSAGLAKGRARIKVAPSGEVRSGKGERNVVLQIGTIAKLYHVGKPDDVGQYMRRNRDVLPLLREASSNYKAIDHASHRPAHRRTVRNRRFEIFDGHEVRTELYVRAAIAKGGAQVRVIPLNAAARRGITDQLVFRRTRGV